MMSHSNLSLCVRVCGLCVCVCVCVSLGVCVYDTWGLEPVFFSRRDGPKFLNWFLRQIVRITTRRRKILHISFFSIFVSLMHFLHVF